LFDAQAGNGSELMIAAVILGGTSLSGGIGNVFGTLLGVSEFSAHAIKSISQSV
jgi:ribose/xylose/arabinose/galactoside ABC-type transport system permease subunit